VTSAEEKPRGLFDAQYRAFLETMTHFRGDLHRYCARMTGSVFDGEDIAQGALFEAYRKIETLAHPGLLRSWLFSIAHNRCIDFMRRQRARGRAETQFAEDQDLVVDSTVGNVKVTLNRARVKLAVLPDEPASVSRRQQDAEVSPLLERDVELFNRHDWDGVRALISADAKLRVADCYVGRLADSPYFIEYAAKDTIWKMEIAEIDGEIVAVVVDRRAGKWQLAHAVRVRITEELIEEVSDYYACPWILAAASSVRTLHPIGN
jgi:RNA polymerase sigma-70 factor, ECF subfamily